MIQCLMVDRTMKLLEMLGAMMLMAMGVGFLAYCAHFAAKEAHPESVRVQQLDGIVAPTWTIILIAVIFIIPTSMIIFSALSRASWVNTVNAQVLCLGVPIASAVCAGIVGARVEAHIWKKYPEKTNMWLQKAQQLKVSATEAEQKEKENRIALASQGVFSCALRGTPLRLFGAYCYLNSGGSMEGEPLVKFASAKITLIETGISFGQLPYYRGELGAHIARRTDPGLASPLVSLASYGVTTKLVSVSVPWNAIDKCIVSTVSGSVTGKAVEYYFFFFHNPGTERAEWIAVYLFSPEEKQIFQETLERHGISVSRLDSPLITY